MQASIMENFELFWELFDPEPEFNNRKRACCMLWEQKGQQQRHAVIEFLKSGKQRSSVNPYYFLADFRQPSRQTLSFADYYAKFGTTEEQGGWHMENPTGQQVIYVKN